MTMAIKKLIATGVLLGFTSIANASFITNWNFVNEAGFSAAVDEDNEAGSIIISDQVLAGDSILSVDTYRSVEWGSANSDAGKSKLIVDSPVTGGIVTDGDFEQGTTITHHNNPLGGLRTDWLSMFTLVDGLHLTASAWNAPGPIGSIAGNAPELTFNMKFFETPNRPGGTTTGGQCFDGTVANDGVANTELGFGCDDYFFLLPNPNLNVSVVNDGIQFVQNFDLIDAGFPQAAADALQLETSYKVTVRLSGLEIADFCPLENTPACIGVRTIENDTNSLFAEFAVSRVSEPGMLAVLGLALFGFGAARRKRS
jgi:hypothetical protein